MGAIVDGFARRDVLGQLDESVVNRIAAIELRVDRLERNLAFQLRQFRGFRIGNEGAIVTPDSQGFIQVYGDTVGQVGPPQYVDDQPKPHGLFFYNGT